MLTTPLLLPKAIREARKKRQWTQIELANHLEVSQGTISFWERSVETPSLTHLIELIKLMPEIFEQLAQQEANILARLYQLERVVYGGKCSCQGCGCASE